MLRSNHKAILVIGVWATIAVPAWGAEESKETPTLTVSATGVLEVAPDIAYRHLGVWTEGKSPETPLRKNDARMKKVLNNLSKLRIEKERIQTKRLRIDPHYKRQPEPKAGEALLPESPEIIGYTITNQIQVEVRDLEKLPKIIESSIASGANGFYAIGWAIRNDAEAYQKALALAVANARGKAKTLAESLNVKLIRIRTITEGTSRASSEIRRYEAKASEGTPMARGEIKVE